MLVYLNFCLTGALKCSIMTYYLALLFSDGLGKESPSRHNLLLLCLANSLSDVQTSREPIILLLLTDISVQRAF